MKNGIDAIRDVLIRFPYGIKARVIASYIPAMDKKSVNQILYGNPAIFFCRNYLWFLKKPVEEQSKVSIRKPTKKALSSLTAPVNIQEKPMLSPLLKENGSNVRRLTMRDYCTLKGNYNLLQRGLTALQIARPVHANIVSLKNDRK